MTLLDQLQQTYEECRAPGWDGYGAEPVSDATYQRVREIMSRWPADAMPPTFGAEPDGCITVEWYGSKGILSVSINETAIIGAHSGSLRLSIDADPIKCFSRMVDVLFGSANSEQISR